MKFRSSNSFSNMELLMARGSQFYLRQKNPLGKFHAAAARARQVRLRTFKRFRDIVRLASESFDAVSRRFYVITIVIQVTLTRERCKYKDSHSSSLSFVFISLVKIASLSGTRAVTWKFRAFFRRIFERKLRLRSPFVNKQKKKNYEVVRRCILTCTLQRETWYEGSRMLYTAGPTCTLRYA